MDVSVGVGIDSYLVLPSGEVRELDPQATYLFGREASAEFSLNDALCSREHCRLRWDASGDWVVEDLGSRNGTLVDGSRVEEAVVLRDRSSIQIGGQRFVLCLLPPGADATRLVAEVQRIDVQETFEMAGGKAEPGPAEPLRGSLQGMEEIIRFFMLTSKNGRFHIDDEHQVWFVDGVPRHAEAVDARGLEALRSLVDCEGGFSFYEGEELPGEPTIEGRIQDILADLFDQADEEERRAEAYDIERATQLQRHLMERMPRIPGYDIGVFFQGLSGVSGDFYDVSIMPDGRVLIVLGDVSGHGIQAAMVGTNILKTLRLLRQRCQDLGELLRLLNEDMREDMLGGQFATLFAAILHPPSGRMEVAIAGHHSALVLDRDGDELPREVGGKGMAMGLGSDAMFSRTLKLETVELAVGESLLQFTDGMFESMDAEGNEFGWDRLREIIAANRDCPDMETLTSVLTSEVSAYADKLEDDLTILAIARVSEVGTKAVLAEQPERNGLAAHPVAAGGDPNPTPQPPTEDAAPLGRDQKGVGYTGREFAGARVMRALDEGRIHLADYGGRDVIAEVVASDEAPADFERRVRPYRELDHPGVVDVLAVGTEDGCCFQLMELLSGGSLAERLSMMGHLEYRELRGLVAPLAAGLAAIHAAGVVHGDLRPASILIDGRGEPKIVRFGALPPLDRHPLAYQAPETLDGSPPGAMADVYGLAAMLYHLACGEPLVATDDPEEARRIVREGLGDLRSRHPGLDLSFVKLLSSCLNIDPVRRPTSAELALWGRPQSAALAKRKKPDGKAKAVASGDDDQTATGLDADTMWLIGGGVVALVLVALILWLLWG